MRLTIFLFALLPLAAQAVDFEKDIQPIFEENCLDCHGPNKSKAAFRVDQRAVMLVGGDSGLQAIVPGDPEKSYLMEVLKGIDPDMQMPPKGDPLSKEDIALIEKWIAEGAEWPGQMDTKFERTSDHWSFQPVAKPEVPASDAKNPVDAFLNTALKEKGLMANDPADAKSLIRRASIILTGLPPTPERVAEFEKAHAENAESAYAALVDELLASPHFGERWAQHWLDVIRWAETNGSEANLYRKNAWVYRDYVVRAFNNDVPYDQFVKEQIFGDRLGSGEATGFLVAGPHVPAATVGREPTAIRQARADRMDEIMQTVGASMLGLTMQCARCHNHKFDPITIQDYYAMTGVFQDIEFGSRYPELAEDHPKKLGAKAVWPAISKQRNFLRKEAGAWVEDWGGFLEVHFRDVENVAAVRLDFHWNGIGVDELEIFGGVGENVNLALAKNGTVVKSAPDMLDTKRNPVTNINDGKYGTMAWRAKAPKDSKEKPWVELEFSEPKTVGRMRISGNREYYFDTDYLEKMPGKFATPFTISVRDVEGNWKKIVSTANAQKRAEEKPEIGEAVEKINSLVYELGEKGPRPSFIGQFIEPVVTKVLHRGSPENPRDEVLPGAPEILNGELGVDSKSPGYQRRQEFGEWVADPENPLTARVMVNRLWHHIFGIGIVPTTSDFGLAGMTPSHPELLEWLAAEFVKPTQSEAEPWSMKAMIRLLVMSDAFRRSSLPDEENLAADAGSALLWRFPPKRVAAEVIRDGILQASGKLNPEIGGRSYRIHNVKKTYAQWEVVDNHGADTWRRMLYQERMRRVDDRIFTAFDFPDCGQVRAKRPVSTTPLQALNLMNSDFVVEQSKFIAARSEKESDEPIHRAFELILNRKPTADELAASKEIGNLAIVCRGLINSNEFAFLP